MTRSEVFCVKVPGGRNVVRENVEMEVVADLTLQS